MTVKGPPGKKGKASKRNPCPPGSKKSDGTKPDVTKPKDKKPKTTPSKKPKAPKDKAPKKGLSPLGLAKPRKSGKMSPDDIADIKRRIEKQKIDRFKNRRLLPGKL